MIATGKKGFAMPAPFRPTARLRRLGAAIRRYRLGKGLTLEEAAAILERTPSSLSKIEKGRTAAPIRELRLIFDAYGVTDEHVRDRLLALARDARKRGWWEQYGNVLSPSYLDFVSLEGDATAARTFQPLVIPGLLQTPDYARVVIESVPVAGPPRDVDQLVGVRLERQHVLTREQPLHLSTIITEGVLRQQIGGRAVLKRQLLHLAEMADRTNIVLQVLPFSATNLAGVTSPFLILQFAESVDLDMVLVEHPTSGLYLEEEDEIRLYNTLFDNLAASALPPADSVTMISKIVREL